MDTFFPDRRGLRFQLGQRLAPRRTVKEFHVETSQASDERVNEKKLDAQAEGLATW